MANTISRSSLGFLGIDFQYRLISVFFYDHEFFSDLNTIIDQNMFTDAYLRGIVAIVKDYYNKYGSVPSYGMLDIKVNEKITSEEELKFYKETIDKIKNVPIEGYKEIEELAEKFFKQQNIIKVANKLRAIAGDGDISKYEECQKIMEDALAIGRHMDDDEWRPFDSLDDDLSKESIVSIPTGIDKLDDALLGGLDKGKIGVIICPSGKGKTSLTTCLTGNAAICKNENNNYQGYKVLQIVFEDTKRDMNRKFISKVSQVEQAKINNSTETENSIRECIVNHPDRELMNNNIRLKRLPTGTYTASDIEGIIKKKINQGFIPDLVIVDYFECLKCERGTEKDDLTRREGASMRVFENMAHDLNIAMWIPTQGNRESFKAEIVTENNVGGSIQKVQIGQVILSISRTIEDMNNNKATIAVLKSRSGYTTVLNGVYFNNGTCTVSTKDVITFNSALEYNESLEQSEEERKRKMIDNARKIYG